MSEQKSRYVTSKLHTHVHCIVEMLESAIEHHPKKSETTLIDNEIISVICHMIKWLNIYKVVHARDYSTHVSCGHRQADRQTVSQAGKQAGMQADRQTDILADKQTDRQTVRQADRQTDRETHSH